MEFTNQNALEIIEKMISNAKSEIRENGFYHQLWGYLVFFSALIDYFLLLSQNESHALVWGITMPIGGIVTFIQSKREIKKQRVVTYVDEVLKHLIIAYVLSILIVCLIMPMTGKHWKSFYPTLMVVYAFGLYATGGIIQFKPLKIGALVVWALAVFSFFVGYDLQLLALAAGVLAGFIIPGHLLNRRFHQDV